MGRLSLDHSMSPVVKYNSLSSGRSIDYPASIRIAGCEGEKIGYLLALGVHDPQDIALLHAETASALRSDAARIPGRMD